MRLDLTDCSASTFSTNRQRPGGKPDNSDLKPSSPFGGMFGFGKKTKEEPEPVVEEKKTNWWTLN